MKFFYFLVIGFVTAGLMTACSPDAPVEPASSTPAPNGTPKVQYRLKKVGYSFANRYFSYENGRLTGERWIGTDGTEIQLVTFTYDARNHLTTYTTRSTRPATPYDLGTRIQYAYDGEGRLLARQLFTLQQGSTPEAPALRLASVDTLSYNSAGQVIATTLYSYKSQGGAFSSQPTQCTRTTYHYDANGDITEEISVSAPLTNLGGAVTARKRVMEYDAYANPYCLVKCPAFGQESWSKHNVVRLTTYQVYLYSKKEQPDFSRATPSVTEFTYTYKDMLPEQKGGAAAEAYEYEPF